MKIYPSYNADKFIKIDNISAVYNKNNKLEINKKAGSFVINQIPVKNFKIIYNLKMNQFQNYGQKSYMGYLCDSYMLTKAAWVFLVPDGVKAQQYTVNFKLPDGWQAVTPRENNGNAYIEKDFKIFIESTIGAGKFDIREKMIKGTKVKIAVDMHHDKDFRDTIVNNCFKIFSYIKSIFNTTLPPTHLTIFAKPTGQYQWQLYNEGSISQGEAVKNIEDGYYQYAHRLFHTYNAFYPYGMRIMPGWFLEGANEYYDSLAKLHIRKGYPLKRLIRAYQDNYLKLKNKYDEPLKGIKCGEKNWERSDFLLYKKGALVSFLLDREIRKTNKGKKSLDDVLQILYKKYGQKKNGAITDDIIVKIANKIAGKNMEYFFNKYINKKSLPDMDKLFSDDDSDGLCFGAEEILGTDPENPDSDKDGASDGIEFKNNTDFNNANSNPGDLIYIDGMDNDWNKIKHPVLKDPLEDSKCNTDIKEIGYKKIKQNLYIYVKFKCDALKDKSLRYYLNIDLNADYYPDLHLAGVYGTPGDMSKFIEDYKTKDYKSMDSVENLESSIGQIVEFKIPLTVLDEKKNIQLITGVWDTKTQKNRDATDWLKFDY